MRYTQPWFRAALAWLLVLLAPLAWAQQPVSAGPSASASPPVLEVFVREGCPHCADAKKYLASTLKDERPNLRVEILDVGRDKAARQRLMDAASRTPGGMASVPAFHYNGELLIGFETPEKSGPKIRHLLDHGKALDAVPTGEIGQCKANVEASSCGLDEEPAPSAEASGSITIPIIDKTISLKEVGLPAFTIAIGLLDGFNPCSMWVLILMMSMLAAVGDRKRMLAIAGTFVAIQGIAYFAFMAAWLNLFLVIGLSRASEIGLGVIALAAGAIHTKDFVAFGKGVSLSIPDKAKPKIYQRMRSLMHEKSIALAIVGTVILGVLVQFVELVCTSGLPALYTRILTLEQLDKATYYGYLLLYNAMYMIDDIGILTVGVVTLSQKRLQEKEGRVLKLISGLAMIGLGIYLLA